MCFFPVRLKARISVCKVPATQNSSQIFFLRSFTSFDRVWASDHENNFSDSR
jgi:hypothetical protein